jgi:hypothetical protein
MKQKRNAIALLARGENLKKAKGELSLSCSNHAIYINISFCYCVGGFGYDGSVQELACA